MGLRTTSERYGSIAQLLHWISAVLIVGLACVGLYMEDLPLSAEKAELYSLHKSTGLTVLALTLIRLVWRLFNPAPPLPAGMPRWERVLATSTHHLLYALLLITPVAGYVISSSSGFPHVYFGWFTVPALIPADKPTQEIAEAVHGTLAWLIIVTFFLHVAGALKHHFVTKDGVLLRMLPVSDDAIRARMAGK
ncbi:MAG: cytochrome b [Alphaproteobacteria bacterium]|nr:cytochrome b [Alphaproteobacteria bacterium]